MKYKYPKKKQAEVEQLNEAQNKSFFGSKILNIS